MKRHMWWSPDYPDPTAFLEIMTKGNAQNNTDWGNEEYDNLIKEANGSLLREPDKRNEALQKLKVFYFTTHQLHLYIKKVKHI